MHQKIKTSKAFTKREQQLLLTKIKKGYSKEKLMDFAQKKLNLDLNFI